MLRWALRGAFGILAVVLITQLVRSGLNQQLVRQAKRASGQTARQAPAAQRPQDAAPDPAAWEQAVVAIQARERMGQQSHGSGFVVGDMGLVATNLHVSASCTGAVVRFHDGTTYEVEGYAAVDPGHDLAFAQTEGRAAISPWS